MIGLLKIEMKRKEYFRPLKMFFLYLYILYHSILCVLSTAYIMISKFLNLKFFMFFFYLQVYDLLILIIKNNVNKKKQLTFLLGGTIIAGINMSNHSSNMRSLRRRHPPRFFFCFSLKSIFLFILNNFFANFFSVQ